MLAKDLRKQKKNLQQVEKKGSAEFIEQSEGEIILQLKERETAKRESLCLDDEKFEKVWPNDSA